MCHECNLTVLPSAVGSGRRLSTDVTLCSESGQYVVRAYCQDWRGIVRNHDAYDVTPGREPEITRFISDMTDDWLLFGCGPLLHRPPQ